MKNPSLIAFSIDRKSDIPVFAQIYDAIRRMIVSGALEGGQSLPPSRPFATDLGVSRSTIMAAYEQLVAEGYAEGRHGSGLYVRPIGEVELPSDQVPVKRPAPVPSSKSSPTARLGWPLLYPGVPDMRLFPYRPFARCVARVARASPQSLVMSFDPFGDWSLREAIAAHVAEWRGIQTSAGQVMITAGSTDALEICIRTLMQRGDRIALEDPGYLPLRNFVESQGLAPSWLKVGPHGAEVPPRETAPKLAVLTPSHQFPMGGAMTPDRRRAFLQWADEAGGWIVEDDYDSEFRYAGRPIPALAGFDQADFDQASRVIYVGSFSKIFSNSLRIGFLIVPEALTDCFAETLSRFGTKASIAPQRALATFMQDGDFYRHLRRVRRIYAERRNAMFDLLKRELGDRVGFDDHQAGMQLVLKLPDGCDDTQIASDARDVGLSPLALSSHFAHDLSGKRQVEKGLVVGFCAHSPEESAMGIKTLRRVMEGQC
tara:strand:- start:4874 stop:6331 length:1458 start_codon:yes stop_codon:yes gene_type:complete